MAVLLGSVKKKRNKEGKIKISYIDSDGYKRYSYATPLELKIISRVINYTIE
jgi:hypothetical protein